MTSKPILLTKHARERAAQRRINTREIREALANGHVIEEDGQPARQTRSGNFFPFKVGATKPGSRLVHNVMYGMAVHVGVNVTDTHTVVTTVYRPNDTQFESSDKADEITGWSEDGLVRNRNTTKVAA